MLYALVFQATAEPLERYIRRALHLILEEP